MANKSTKEPQYNILFETAQKHGISKFGLMANESWNEDPKRTLFTLSRYKFVAKILAGKSNVLEVGCADAFGTRIVQQEVSEVTAIDFDEIFINDAKTRSNPNWPLNLMVHDILNGPVISSTPFDGAYTLDVLEHIKPEDEELFLKNIILSIGKMAPVIVGMPSLESQSYASKQSKEGHINCKTGASLKLLLEKYFSNVFLFSMNDEVVHTGFYPMAHYLIAICCNPKPN
jgi:2-polyprenyl-3-methyl-5-hydroxy-6-metoxy-1,4-benzoquinol methylase